MVLKLQNFSKDQWFFNTLTDISQTENDLNLISRLSTKVTWFFKNFSSTIQLNIFKNWSFYVFNLMSWKYRQCKTKWNSSVISEWHSIQLLFFIVVFVWRLCSIDKLCDDIRILHICFLYLIGIAFVKNIVKNDQWYAYIPYIWTNTSVQNNFV